MDLVYTVTTISSAWGLCGRVWESGGEMNSPWSCPFTSFKISVFVDKIARTFPLYPLHITSWQIRSGVLVKKSMLQKSLITLSRIKLRSAGVWIPPQCGRVFVANYMICNGADPICTQQWLISESPKSLSNMWQKHNKGEQANGMETRLWSQRPPLERGSKPPVSCKHCW